MQGILALIAVGLVVTTPWALAVTGLLALALVAFFALDFTKSYIAARQGFQAFVAQGPGTDPVERALLVRRIEELEEALTVAQRDASALRVRNGDLQRDLRAAQVQQGGTRNNPLYRQVGLDQDAPEWVIAAVRKAYRAKLHPDRYSPRLRAEATRRFQDAEAVFDEIEAAHR